uniref:Beta-galactosidase n=2 Tax=Lygus hesperus TaxID=30085 RepID=A0A0A9X8K5_LYGHE
MLLRWMFCLLGVLAVSSADEVTQRRSFEISFDSDTFLMDGKPFKYISGSLHYFRVPHQYWKDRLNKIRLLGFNAVSTYVEWSMHELSRGVFNFQGDADLETFIKLAQQMGLFVILRPGPYICAEREFGGYPAWLLSENPNMKMRTSDPSHAFFIEKWFHELFSRLKPLLYGNGGPIIMVQVENEYGSYPKHDKKYLSWLRDLYLSHIGDKAVLFTTDGWNQDMVNRGRIPGVFSTVDFGSIAGKSFSAREEVQKLFAPLRKIQPKGPLVNSEFYTGWLSYWGEPFATVDTANIIRTMRGLIQTNVSFNCYMIQGGTNFGYSSGSGSSDTLKLSLTSYDYDAPINEAGDLTEKYFAIRELLEEYGMRVGDEKEIEALKTKPKGDYGIVEMEPVVSLLQSSIGSEPVETVYPLTMESFNQSYGFIAYTHTVTDPPKDPSVLQVNIRDRALVLLDNVEISVLAYTVINETPLPPTMKSGMNLTLLVENQGRRNFQLLSDVTKGIISNATLDGKILENWSTVSYPLTPEDIKKIEEMATIDSLIDTYEFPVFLTASFTLPPPAQMNNEVRKEDMRGSETKMSEVVTETNAIPAGEQKLEQTVVETSKSRMPEEVKDSENKPQDAIQVENQTPAVPVNSVQMQEEVTEAADLTTTVAPTAGNDAETTSMGVSQARRKREIKSDDFPLDSYLDMTGWGKGLVFINGHNLGRYWHIGPQMTLFVPGVWLLPYPQKNRITILELHYAPHDKTVRFSTQPIFNITGPTVRQIYK